MPIVPVNAMVKDPKELGAIPLRPGENVYLRDLATIEDSTDIPTGYALVNGKRAVYILVTKRADASTLAVVNEVRANLPQMREAVPPDIDVDFEFDQSPYVTRAMWGVGTEGLICAGLTGLMVLLFLRDLRSVIVVVLNIPLSLLGSVVALWLSGQTLNLMTLSGLALSIGILVDEATVEVENIHTQYEHTPNIARAVRLGNHADGGAAPAGHALRPGGVPAVVLHAGGGPGTVRAAVAGGRLLHDDVLFPVEHVRAGAVGLAAAALPPDRQKNRPRDRAVVLAGPAASRLRRRHARRSCRSAGCWSPATSSLVGLVIWLVGGHWAGRSFRAWTPASSSSASAPRTAPASSAPKQIAMQALESSRKKPGRTTSSSRSATSASSVRAIPSTTSFCGRAGRRKRCCAWP